jgi:hypothetical protein
MQRPRRCAALVREPRHIALLLLLILLPLITPLAYACLPDETSLGGLWDGADDDDAILRAQSLTSTVETVTLWSADLGVVVGFTLPLIETAVIVLAASTIQPRAPPAL